MSAAHATTTLEKARSLLEQNQQGQEPASSVEADPYEELSWKELMWLLTGEDLSLCPRCGQGRMVPVPLEAVVWASEAVAQDSS